MVEPVPVTEISPDKRSKVLSPDEMHKVQIKEKETQQETQKSESIE